MEELAGVLETLRHAVLELLHGGEGARGGGDLLRVGDRGEDDLWGGEAVLRGE